MLVDRADLEETLTELRQRCADPVAGPWGPRSVMWRVSREKGVLLAGGRAALLAAHLIASIALDAWKLIDRSRTAAQE